MSSEQDEKKKLQEDILWLSRIRLGMHSSGQKSIENELVPYSGIAGAIGARQKLLFMSSLIYRKERNIKQSTPKQ